MNKNPLNWQNMSCYIDSLFMALFFNPSNYILQNMINIPVPTGKVKECDLSELHERIIDIYNYIQGKNDTCPNTAGLISYFKKCGHEHNNGGDPSFVLHALSILKIYNLRLSIMENVSKDNEDFYDSLQKNMNKVNKKKLKNKLFPNLNDYVIIDLNNNSGKKLLFNEKVNFNFDSIKQEEFQLMATIFNVPGHYYSYVKDTNGEWYFYNMSSLTKSSFKEMMDKNERSLKVMLFYDKVVKKNVELEQLLNNIEIIYRRKNNIKNLIK